MKRINFSGGAVKYLKISTVFLAVLMTASFSFAQTSTASDTTSVGDEHWSKDADKKLDQAIAVLKVLKEEVKEVQKEEASREAAGISADYTTQTFEQQVETAQTLAARAARMWRKIMTALGKEEEARQQEREFMENAGEVAGDLSKKIEISIKAMESVRKELDEFDKEVKKDTTR